MAAFWLDGLDAVAGRLGATPAGLSSSEADARRGRFGPNLAVVRTERSLVARLAHRLAEPLVAILLIAAAVTGLTGDWQSAAVILVIVAGSIGLDMAQERQAARTVAALKRSVAVTARVQRDGEAAEIAVAEIVPGDIVEIGAGELVPADGLVIAAAGAVADEAVLTGEPYGVEKHPAPPAPGEGCDEGSALFGGTSLVSGSATMLVVATGADTRFGAIAEALQASAPPTSFERGVHALGMLILRLTGFLVLAVLLAQLLRHGLTLEGFLFAVALAVGLTPELLPMVMTVTLARGAARMARRKVVVKRLAAIHDLGAMDILCTDKTGTLTEARIAHVASLGWTGAGSARVAGLAALNARFVGGLRNNLDQAILAARSAKEEGWTRLDDLPFDFERRRASVLLERGGERIIVTKGAPEAVLARATHCEEPDGTLVPLDADRRAAVDALIAGRGREGLRLLAVGWRPAEASALTAEGEAGLILSGFAVFLDPPKASATAAVARLVRAGIRVKIISGDGEAVVSHLVGTLSLPATGMLTGAEIAAMSDAALATRAPDTDLFVRVAPDQKARIVAALRRRGHVVGFIGDGINDAPAIHAADVGLSVDGGADVAREAADIILLDPDLGVLADGVAEGRRTYANIMKYVRMGTSSNFGNMLSVAVASMLLPFLPLAPLQILLNNLVYDLSEIGIPFDRDDGGDETRPQVWDMHAVLRFTLVMGPLSSLFDFLTFGVLLYGFDADVATFRTGWFVESIATQILVIFLIRTAGPFWKGRPNPILVLTSLGALALALGIALGPFGAVFGFVALPAPLLLAIAVIAALYLGSAEVLKRFAMGAATRGGGGIVPSPPAPLAGDLPRR
ncbi:magnesium-translocating P-type ATPase [Kaistia geumhonensis]|uniref:Magnesium-transporting ATPase, P-type 1 n=1 Tax=Kaistia geumhonensis TaxID=410839 RepID=A0ABU0M3Y5_9HYPH|nr:magnesium-translocating P-type ATPase [Kaistia geumhonensis]MCX5479116.1 magnesium-translocating P-type ATPase [Kaistia geumhonensis]MDQ0515664.1 Mg2+-importing ATPase [Kaistia geumhonensis]